MMANDKLQFDEKEMSYNEVVPMEIYVNDYQEKVKDFVVNEDLLMY